jgi:hypothetical protein
MSFRSSNEKVSVKGDAVKNSSKKPIKEKNSFAIDPLISKTLAGFAIATVIDLKYFQSPEIKRSVMFGASVATGILLSSQVSKQIVPDVGGVNGLIDGRTTLMRVGEVAGGSLASYGLNRFILKNDFDPSQAYKRIGAVAVSSIASEFISDYLSNQALGYLV